MGNRAKSCFSKIVIVFRFNRNSIFHVVSQYHLGLQVDVFSVLSIILRSVKRITVGFFKRRISVSLLGISPISTVSHQSAISFLVGTLCNNSFTVQLIVLSLFSSFLLLSHRNESFHVLFHLLSGLLAK